MSINKTTSGKGSNKTRSVLEHPGNFHSRNLIYRCGLILRNEKTGCIVIKKSICILVGFLIIQGCVVSPYIYDTESLNRQTELKKKRSGNILSGIGLTVASLFILAAADYDPGLYPEEREFKKLKMINPSEDTIYVNMLTDVYWDEENYCDFYDIRIPPGEKCRVMVPVDANYNLYFSNTPESEDDELLEINTRDFKRISLYQGLTILNDSINLNH